MFESASVEIVAVATVAFLAGACAPTYYATEQLRGFGRALFGALPYQPLPGMTESEAMAAAMESAEDAESDVEERDDDSE